MPLGENVPRQRRAKEGHPLKRRYFTAIGSFRVKIVADRHRHAAYHNEQQGATSGNELLRNVNIDDLD